MMFGDFPEMEEPPMSTHPVPVAAPGNPPITPEDLHRLRQLDDAVADLVEMTRDHIGKCPVRPAGVCLGESDHIVRQMPPAVWYDLLCQAIMREASGRGQTPPYAHRMLDAIVDVSAGLEFPAGMHVPADIRDRLAQVAAAGRPSAVSFVVPA